MDIARTIDDLNKLSVVDARLLNLTSWGYNLKRGEDNTITAEHESGNTSLPILIIDPAQGILKKYWHNEDKLIHRDNGMPSQILYEEGKLKSISWHFYGKLIKNTSIE